MLANKKIAVLINIPQAAVLNIDLIDLPSNLFFKHGKPIEKV
jgi:hypothetical protein